MEKREGSEVEDDKIGIKNRWEGHYDYHCGVRKGQGAEKGTLPVPQAVVHVLNKDKKLNVECHPTYNTQQLIWTFNNLSLTCYIFIMHFTLGEELYWSMISSILGCLCHCIPCCSVCVSFSRENNLMAYHTPLPFTVHKWSHWTPGFGRCHLALVSLVADNAEGNRKCYHVPDSYICPPNYKQNSVVNYDASSYIYCIKYLIFSLAQVASETGEG